MKTIQKKIEAYRLTISGLEEDTDYNSLFMSLLKDKTPKDLVYKIYSKSHSIMSYSLNDNLLFTRYISYKKGHRPDIINLNEFSVSPNPLSPSETGVEWTHSMGGYHLGKYYILLEHNYYGITSSSLTIYLTNIILDYQKTLRANGVVSEPWTINLEAVPGIEFLSRLKALGRIKTAKVRIVKPNPGWKDLESELGQVSDESHSGKTDVSMSAPRGKSLSKDHGIVGWIISKFNSRTLDYAEVSGESGNRVDTFNTKKLGKSKTMEFSCDENDQVKPKSIKDTLAVNFNDVVE